MKKLKLFSLALMALFSTGLWGDVYKTYTLSDLTRNGLTYEVTGLSSNDQKLSKGERKVEVPCSNAEGTLYLSGTGANADRYASIWGSNGTAVDESRQIDMTKGYNPNGIAFTADDILKDGDKYYIIFSRVGTSDYKINAFKYTLSQTCSSGDDKTAPTLSSSVPANSATNVAKSGTIILTFSEDIATVDDTKFTLTNATKGEVTIDSDPTKVKVTYSGAASGATVTLAVAAEAVADAAGNKSAALSNISFTVITSICPAGMSISGTAAYTAYETISLTAALTAGNEEITYTWYKGANLEDAKGEGSIGTGTSFSKVACSTDDAGNYFCVATKDGCDENASSAYAVTVAAATACTTLTPATSGDSPTDVGNEIRLQEGSTGGKIIVADYKDGKSVATSFTYTANGLSFNNGGKDSVRVELNHLMKEGTVIVAVVYNTASDDTNHGLTLQNLSKTTKATWTDKATGSKTYSYTVVAGDGLAGKNAFILARSNTAALTSLTVANCGSELFELSSAVSVEGKGTVTLSKTILAEGGTATATYSSIDAEYDFDEWVISGTGATIDDASANPVTITMGSADAVITLKLKAAAGVKHTVTYFDNTTNLGSELVTEGQHPTGAGLTPKKRSYTFSGWSLTNGGEAVTLSEVTINTDKSLYAVWTPVDCPTSGTIFSFVMNESAKPSSDVKAPQKGTSVIDEYLTISGLGSAIIGNTTNNTNQYAAVKTTPNVNLTGATGYLQLALECALQASDKITITKNNSKVKISEQVGASGPAGEVYSTATNAENEITVGAESDWIGSKDLYIWYNGGGVTITGVSVTRPDGGTTALDNTADEVKAVKRIENGMLIIEKNGIRYNAQGQVIR